MDVLRIDGADARVVAAAVPSALRGTGPVLGLGFGPAFGSGFGAGFGSAPRTDLPAGTAALITTSGSSGVPKTVILGAAALRASAEATAARIGTGSWLLALPAAYVAGLQVLVRAHLAGTAPVFLDGRFSPASFTAAVERMPAGKRYTSLVPAQLATLLDATDEDAVVHDALRSFEGVLVGGQALPSPLRERAARLGVRLVRTYGSTETSGGCVYDGVPLHGVDVRVVGGELQIAGPTLADGYLGENDLTTRVFPIDPDGTRWYRTGDLGSLVGGVVRVEGRIDNVIVSGGVNVSLDRVEAAVRGVPGLAGAVVVGVADERWGEASVIVLAPDAGRADGAGEDDALLAAAREAVAAAVAPAARPARLLRREVPFLPSGKPDRAALRTVVGAQ